MTQTLSALPANFIGSLMDGEKVPFWLNQRPEDRENFCLLTDAYKQFHWAVYPEGLEYTYSYLESRGGMFDEVLWFGLQRELKKYFCGKVLYQWMIDEAFADCQEIFGFPYFNKAGFQRLLDKWGGVLPIEIRAVKEGTRVSVKNVMMTVVNTDPEFPWLTNFIESKLLHVWYPSTVATLSRKIKELGREALEKTCSLSEEERESILQFMLNDFGFRSCSSLETAKIGGMAHAINFKGSDTLVCNREAKKFYDAVDAIISSVAATEHSVMTALGIQGELAQIARALDICKHGLISIVCDSYDLKKTVTEYIGDTLRDKVRKRDGRLVVRPDSGKAEVLIVEVLDILGDKFGYEYNSKGYKVLPDCVRVIWGDGINYYSIIKIINAVIESGWSIENCVFGMGGALLQKVDRDTQKWAFKCSAMCINGKWVHVFKDPKTDPGKTSKKGRLSLNYIGPGAKFTTIEIKEGICQVQDKLELVLYNGKLMRNQTWEDICALSDKEDYSARI
jgi:nicotinamide phosphoribosyltransferase